MSQVEQETLEKLVIAAQAGNTSAMAQLIEMYQNKLYRFCIYLAGQPPLAQDLTQDTFISVLENLVTLKDPARFQSWLFTSAKNLYLDHLRLSDNAPYIPIEELDDSLFSGDSAACENVLQMQQVLAMLEPEDRFLLLLVDLEGLSYSEAAAQINIKEASVASRLHRIRELFMQNYKGK